MAECNTFPVYKVDALLEFSRSEVLTGQEAKHFTRNDLAPSPKPDSIQRLYIRTLELLFLNVPECHSMVPLSVDIQNPAFHERTTAMLSVFVRMQQFLPMCFVYDFSLNDLLAPKFKRTLVILSGIMNFLLFRKQRMEMTVEHQERFREDMDKFQHYTKTIKQAEKTIDKLTTIPPEQQAEAKELAATMAELDNATKHQYQEVNALNEQITEWKTENAERSQKLTQLRVDVTTLKEDIGKLKSQVVESPEELKNQMENVKNIKLSIEQADERMGEYQGAVQGVSHNEAELQVVLKLLQDLQTSMDKANQHQDEVQQLVCLYEKQQKDLRSLATEEVQVKRALGMKMDKKAKLQIRRQKKKETTDQHVKDVLGQCDHVHQKREDMAAQIQEISRQTHQIRAEIQRLRDVCKQETEKAQAVFDRILGSLNQFHKRIESHVVEGNNDMKITFHFK